MSGPLKNARHERFAHGLAKGKCQTDAYEAAGYRPSRSAAARLAADVNICARVAELQGRAAVRAEISVASATEHLLKLAEMAKALGDAPGIQASRASMMDACKLNGLIVDRTEQRLADDQLAMVIGSLKGDPDAARRMLDELKA